MTTTGPEIHGFQAETRELLDLMIHSLYTHREIFLRELISNSSDALDKRRFASLTDESLRQEEGEPAIRLERDPEARTLVIEDDGIGMTREEVVQNIGTIARSGTKAFRQELEKAKAESGEAAPELIGQFGVGFYSSFMVAEKVVLETRKAGTDEAVRWSSEGDGQFTLEAIEKERAGTRITLHLRPLPEEGEDGTQDGTQEDVQDFTDEWTLRGLVKRYSDFVAYPIQMDVERTEGEGDEAETVTKTETLNSMQPLWTRPRNEVEESEYHDFYRHLSHDWRDPLTTVHFKAEGTHEYTALLFVPEERPHDILDPAQNHSKLSLYVKRVFVMKECEDLLPSWMRFVRGLVDSNDLPLNVSRETLQHTRQMKQIQKRLVKKVLESLGKQLGDARRRYTRFWGSLGPVLKEGLFLDDDVRDELAGLCLFQSSAGAAPAALAPAAEDEDESVPEGPCPWGYTTLAEYVERMPLAQPAIYYVTGAARAAVERSPHIEAARAKGYEVLFFVDPVDEWVLQKLTSFGGKELKSLDRGEGLDEATDADHEADKEKHAELLTAAQESLDDYVKEVRLSKRLRSSPAVLVSGEGDLSPQMIASLKAAGHDVPEPKRVLELNPDHAVLDQLSALRGTDDQRFHLYLELLHGQALLAEGTPLPDPSRFARLVTELMAPGSLAGEEAPGPGAASEGAEGGDAAAGGESAEAGEGA